MLTRQRLNFNHFRKQKFRHSFKDKLNPFCSCIVVPTIHYYFRHCRFYNSNQATLMNDLKNIFICFSTVSHNNLISLVLYGVDKFDDIKNRKILMPTIRFIKNSQRFDEQFF